MLEELIVIIVSAMPILELRGGIPLALNIYHFSLTKSIILSLIGNMIPVFLFLFSLKYVYEKWENFPLISWMKKRTHSKFAKKYEVYNDLALIFLVAIPLPLTGAYTAILASIFFGIKPLKSILFIFIGLIIAAGIMSVSLMGINKMV